MIGTETAVQEHGRALIEAAKDHLAATLHAAPPEGWTAAEWANAAGVLIDGAAFPAVLVHHLAPVLVTEGRARAVDADATPPRYAVIAQHEAPDEPSARAMATAAPRLWAGGEQGSVVVPATEARALEEAAADAFPEGAADENQDRPPKGHTGPWIP